MLKSLLLAAVCAVSLSGCVIIANDGEERTVVSASPEFIPDAVDAGNGGGDTAADAARRAHYPLALADSRRPPEDVARDPLRHPDAMMDFMHLDAGDAVADIRPEEGYFTRVFAPVVGPAGHVYAFVPTQTASREDGYSDALAAAFPNVSRVTGNLETMTFGAPLDVVFMGQEYHDFTIPRFGVDVAKMNAAVFAALKPGGLYVILDHQAAAGAGISVSGTLHRIEGAELRREVEAAGFIFDGETDAVANPADDHSLRVFDEAIRGRTDQFVYRFRKPG